MKKFAKKLLSAVMAVSCVVSSVAMNVNALDEDENERFTFETIIPSIDGWPEGFVQFDDSEVLFKLWQGNFRKYDMFKGAYTDGESYYMLRETYPRVVISAPYEFSWDNINETSKKLSEVRAALRENFTWEESAIIGADIDGNMYVALNDKYYDITISDIREMMEVVNKVIEIDSCYYTEPFEFLSKVQSACCEDITDYIYLEEEECEALQNYVEENNFDFTVEIGDIEGYKRCHLIPNENMTIEEQFAAIKKISNDLKIKNEWITSGLFVYDNNFMEDITVDVFNSIEGDANEDSEMNIADATAVIQAIGNPDEYALTKQGIFNADLDGDGLTGMDAVAIQSRVAMAGMPE